MNAELSRQCEQRLLDMREAIASLQAVRKAGSGVVELDQSCTGRLTRMDALQFQAMAVAGRERADLELRRIEAALERIRSGTFGECVDCGEVIERGRVEAHPTVTRCVSCAEERERS